MHSFIWFKNIIYGHNKSREEIMNKSYEEVPSMISSKDLNYLSDIYDWNFNISKLADHFSKEVNDEEIKELLLKVKDVHREHAKFVLNILK